MSQSVETIHFTFFPERFMCDVDERPFSEQLRARVIEVGAFVHRMGKCFGLAPRVKQDELARRLADWLVRCETQGLLPPRRHAEIAAEIVGAVWGITIAARASRTVERRRDAMLAIVAGTYARAICGDPVTCLPRGKRS